MEVAIVPELQHQYASASGGSYLNTNVMVRATTVCLLLTAGSQVFRAQLPAMVDLVIDVENVVEYQGDISDPLTFAKNQQLTPSKGYRPGNPEGIGNFAVNTGI